MSYQKTLLVLSFIFLGTLSNARDLRGFYIGIGTGINATHLSSFQKVQPTIPGGPSKIYDWGDNLTGLSTWDVQALSGLLGFPIEVDLGYRFSPYWSLEMGAFHSGSQFFYLNSGGVHNKSKASQYYVSANIVGYAPLIENYLYLKGKLGIAGGHVYFTGLSYGDHYDQTNSFVPTMGVGLQYVMTDHLTLDLDYTSTGLFSPLKVRYSPPKGIKANVPDNLVSNNYVLLKLNIIF